MSVQHHCLIVRCGQREEREGEWGGKTRPAVWHLTVDCSSKQCQTVHHILTHSTPLQVNKKAEYTVNQEKPISPGEDDNTVSENEDLLKYISIMCCTLYYSWRVKDICGGYHIIHHQPNCFVMLNNMNKVKQLKNLGPLSNLSHPNTSKSN